MSTFTTNLHLELVDFNVVTWHDQENANFIIIDAALSALGAARLLGVWQNSTAYVIGDKVVDAQSFSMWECLVNHTSAAAPTLFATDRVAHPTFWQVANATQLLPTTDDISSIGAPTHRFANAYLKSGGTINFNNGNYIITHSPGTMTFSGILAVIGAMTVGGAATITGLLTSLNDVVSNLSFIGSGPVVVATTGPNTVFFRPNGSGSGTGQVTIDSTGLMTLAAGQIKFPAAQNPSADANTFDDYEEGTFTPRIDGITTAGVGTYTSQVGKYTKLGDLVAYDITLVWTAHTGTGNMLVAGLPFTANAASNVAAAMWFSNLTFVNTPVSIVALSTTQILPQSAATGGAATTLAIDVAASLCLSGHYHI